MVNNTYSSFKSAAPSYTATSVAKAIYPEYPTLGWARGDRQSWLIFAAASFLVSVPVFLQAPLVRQLPILSLVITAAWVWLGWRLRSRPATQVWGDLLLGFSWSWLAGSIYWGWLRWEPLMHLPVESIGIPFILWRLWQNKRTEKFLPVAKTPPQQNLKLFPSLDLGMVGTMFYLGSLFGTAVTDLYFYLTGLIPHWRLLMRVEPALATPIFQQCLVQISTPWGAGWAAVLVSVLLVVGFSSLRSRQIHWWAFGGAVLSTILVDSLFWLAASIA